MAQLTLLLMLFAATIVLGPLAERLKVPYPILLLVFGLLVAFVPGLPRADISPDLILPLVLPPLLFAAARRTSWREFLDNRRAIGLLAVALVAVTMLAVGFLVQALVPGLPLIAAITLGAMVAPRSRGGHCCRPPATPAASPHHDPRGGGSFQRRDITRPL